MYPMRVSPALAWVDISMRVCFSEVGLSSVRHNPIRTPESLPPSLSASPYRTWGMDTPRQQQKKWTNVRRGNDKRNTWRDRRRFSTRQKLFYCCTRALLSIFILKVCYLKGHLLEIAVVAKDEKWGQKAKRMTEVKKKKSQRGQTHFFGHLFELPSPEWLDQTLTWRDWE